MDTQYFVEIDTDGADPERIGPFRDMDAASTWLEKAVEEYVEHLDGKHREWLDEQGKEPDGGMARSEWDATGRHLDIHDPQGNLAATYEYVEEEIKDTPATP